MAASLIRHRGLELPVYPCGTDIAYPKSRLKTVGGERSRPSFVRGTLLSILSQQEGKRIATLQEALRVADEGFTEVAAGCGAIVIKHSWGLYNFAKDPSPNNAQTGARALGRRQGLSLDRELIPTGHILVAEVETIRPSEGECELLLPSPAQQNRIVTSAIAYAGSRIVTDEPYWIDYTPHQFANGISLEQRHIKTKNEHTLADLLCKVVGVKGQPHFFWQARKSREINFRRTAKQKNEGEVSKKTKEPWDNMQKRT